MIQPTPGGVVLTVHVIPRARTAHVAGHRGDALLVRLVAPPVEGAANAELVEVLANALEVPRRAIRILAGERSRRKRVEVTGITVEIAASRLGG
jgi:uncharacterized protein (TIGR00251 family)